MSEKKTSVFENGLIWFGAAVSIAEIITGTYLAPLGFVKGFLAILFGHLIGCIMLFLSGVIGGTVRKSAMETVKLSFGQNGSCLFALLNIIQLIGWTGIMIYDGAIAANGILNMGMPIWSIVIGALIILWILVGINNLGKLNTITMSGLFVLSIALSVVVFRGNGVADLSSEAISFGAAVELSVAMPLSWLPLISDYTRTAEKPIIATAVSSIVYGIISCWMYLIGMGAAIFTAEYNIANIMIKSGFGMIGLIIIVLSTVTTTFLDSYSAGVSSQTLWGKLRYKPVAVIVTVLGVIGAVFLPLENISGFLYFIGSVFAPMIAVQIADFFILKKDCSGYKVSTQNIIIWAIGFVAYRLLMRVDIIVGNTLPDMIFTVLLCILVEKIKCAFKNRKKAHLKN